jgi:hypothetical protein
MFNPETIKRDYLSYLDQAALDPFNTIYNSGNLIAPPSFINFSFSLVFDRQIQEHDIRPESRIPDGVLHDYQYFDIVVRNVPPFTEDSPFRDNGVMMVNPQEIVVFFSRELVVRGRPTNAAVNFIKFSHNMIPTRMEIELTMIISYFGHEAGLGSGQMEPAPPDNIYPALVPYDTYFELPTEETIRNAASAAKEAFAKIKDTFISVTKSFLSAIGGGLSAILGLFTGSAGASNGSASAGDPAAFGGNGATSPPGGAGTGNETAIADSYGGHTSPGQIPKTNISIGGKSVNIATATVPAWAAMDRIIRKHGYQVREAGGFCWRTKRGSSGRSVHSYGLAVDINPGQNPMSKAFKTDMPAAMTNEICALKTGNGVTVFSWGGNWNSTKDTMHYQIRCMSGDIATGIKG